jgi:hypothetical protein
MIKLQSPHNYHTTPSDIVCDLHAWDPHNVRGWVGGVMWESLPAKSIGITATHTRVKSTWRFQRNLTSSKPN